MKMSTLETNMSEFFIKRVLMAHGYDTRQRLKSKTRSSLSRKVAGCEVKDWNYGQMNKVYTTLLHSTKNTTRSK